MEQTLDAPLPANSPRPRNAFVAFLFSLILSGLGQVYNGQIKKAIIFFCLPLLIPFLYGVIRGTTFFYGLLSMLIILVSLKIYIIIDGIKNAKRQKSYILKPYNTWYHYLIIGTAMIAVTWAYDYRSVLGTQTFTIPSPSNNPTFQIGDCVVADMRAYKYSEPDYGDIVVFQRPDDVIYTFRVVGRPNDTLELNDNIVTVNGKPGKVTFIKEKNLANIAVKEFEEELPNGHKHLIHKFSSFYDSTKTTIKNIVVPADHYYLLGDSRDNALDSRYEGFVSKEKILGRIIYSYWGKATNRINIDFRDK